MAINTKVITENSTCVIDDKYAIHLKNILNDNPKLPIHLIENTIYFDDYTIGELRIDDLCIKIEPRNKAFVLVTFFQILQYLDQPLLKDMPGFGFNETQSLFDISSLSSSFCKILDNLLQYGMTGQYNYTSEKSMMVNGDIVFDSYIPQLLPFDGIETKSIFYSNNSISNQIIKSALLKLILIENSSVNPEKYQILREFDFVDDNVFSLIEVDECLLNFFSPNPYYIIALELSKKILFNFKLEYKDGNIEWLAFLENSNAIFEKYILKILQVNLSSHNFEKWDEPKTFAKLKTQFKTGKKSYSPDILINFNKRKSCAAAILDVKNKKFEPSKTSDLSNLVSTSDIYQLIFYCKQLNTNVGGLVYPSSTTNEPVELEVETEGNLKIFLISINVRDNIDDRHRKLITDVLNVIFANT